MFAETKSLMRVFTWFLVVLIVSCFVMFYKIGERSLYNPDEGRYAQIAKEMVESGNWIQPHLYGADYLAKPPMFYWLTSISYKLFGISEFSSRFTPALFGVLGILATFWFVRVSAGLKPAVFSAFILLANFWYVAVSRFMVIDTVFSFFIVMCLYAFYAGFTSQRHKILFYNLFYVLLAFAFLTKGFACFILTAVPVLAYLIYSKKFHIGLKLHNHIWGLIIFVIITGFWLVWISFKEPEFIKNFVWHDHIERYLSRDFEHQRPWYFFFLLTPLFLMPVLFFVEPIIKAVKNPDRDTRDLNVFCLICAGFIILFFSISRTKLPTYITPAIPFLCINLGIAWAQVTGAKLSFRIWSAGLVLLVLIGVCAVISVLFFEPVANKFPIRKELVFAGSTAVFFTALGFIFLKKNNLAQLFACIVVAMVVIYIPINSAMVKIIHLNYSTKSFAEKLNPILNSNDKVYLYGTLNHLYDFQFYLRHPVSLVGLTGEIEETYDSDDNVRHITEEQFANLLSSGDNFYVLLRKKYYPQIQAQSNGRTSMIMENADKILLKSGS